MSSLYTVKNDFLGYIRNFNTEYALLSIDEKTNVKNTFLIVLIEPSQYKTVENYNVSQVAIVRTIANTRSNTKN